MDRKRLNEYKRMKANAWKRERREEVQNKILKLQDSISEYQNLNKSLKELHDEMVSLVNSIRGVL